ncbi:MULTISPECIES: cytochrome d ubiquinol oxidase subunit II [Aneurinibacillus]|uniref:Cytochrome d ubiquinol oxidase subunit II n=1 Tax=Aneurinibacillus thermoaerophilus TaxID=143495 RepID=A0A1G8D347_ANETH|nr:MULTISPECIES: cytochrome d ubiquinol oxidase subunit II [Aneurinibacillus]AMA74260.1 cytochrome D ubiquinol oxidase subunit II [Aneurinibacillus sp. XH2]MED0675739.1 cytochrome d ubiquinol oxidase subunit II [Aneurinibacillus thermoaerophilus]MED0680719.1 cytochrome d ubiquinol oxidase subunit II [Aneurinibacillus thermoaerophilus]MED0736781.1 cytochrome d ubiquinol oxidase subunit II [Aneurinibacillus thermoaerophilus]MED0758875.1 cytochrome d ubiquinol oxidase subunit II [Aneurinibacillus
MSYEAIGISVLWTFLYGYLIVASIDFGAGFFFFYGKWKKKDHIINGIIARYLSPVWGIANVFLVFFFAGLIGFFPDAATYYGAVFLVPGSVALMLLVVRGFFYALAHFGARENLSYLFIYGITGLLIPASLSTVFTISEGGFITEQPEGYMAFTPGLLFTSPYSWAVVLLAIVSVLFISTSFLTYYANKVGNTEAMELLRRFALFWSGPTLLASVIVFITLRAHNAWHFGQMIDVSWMFIASLLFFVIAVYFIAQRQALGTAFIMVMLQFGFAFFGYGVSHMPYLLYPYLMIRASVTSSQLGLLLVVAFIISLCLLIPVLYFLMRFFLFNGNHPKRKLK